MIPVLAAGATVYSVVTILLMLLQARQMLARHASCDVSETWLAANLGGYAIWLCYGAAITSIPLMISDGLGLICGGITLFIAMSVRGSCAEGVVK